jgi:hypothetical protein
MQRRRTLAGPPVRSATEAWGAVAQLLTNTLTVSTSVSELEVAAALAPLAGLAPALIAAGHLERAPLVLVDAAMHLSISVATGTAALELEENLNPVPGGASSTSTWVLHVPCPPTFAAGLNAVISGEGRLTLAPAPDGATSQASAPGALIDLTALDKLRDST